jgi:hypothetical protein
VIAKTPDFRRICAFRQSSPPRARSIVSRWEDF